MKRSARVLTTFWASHPVHKEKMWVKKRPVVTEFSVSQGLQEYQFQENTKSRPQRAYCCIILNISSPSQFVIFIRFEVWDHSSRHFLMNVLIIREGWRPGCTERRNGPLKMFPTARVWLEEEITIAFPVSLLVSSILKLFSTTANFHFIVLCSKVLTRLHSLPTIFRCKTFVYGIGNNNIFKY